MFQTNNSPIRWVLVLYALDRGGLWGTVLKEDWEVESLCKFMHLYSEAKCPFGCKHTTSHSHLVYSHHSPDGHQDVPLPTFFSLVVHMASSFGSLQCLLLGKAFLGSVQLLIHVWLFATPWTAAHQASLSITDSRSLFKLMSIDSVMPSNHLILCHPLLLLTSVFPSIRVLFQWVGSLHQVAKALELQLQHQSFQWIFRTDFL